MTKAAKHEAEVVKRECEAEERARIVRWLKSYNDTHSRHALAERIERGEHESF